MAIIHDHLFAFFGIPNDDVFHGDDGLKDSGESVG